MGNEPSYSPPGSQLLEHNRLTVGIQNSVMCKNTEGDVGSTWYSTWDAIGSHKVADAITSVVIVEPKINIIPCEIISLFELRPA